MTKDQKNEVIELLKGKFSQYNNFYITDTESLTVAQIGKLRRVCFDKNVELKVAKNTLVKKALESLDSDKYAGVFESLHKVTALMFSESAKEPALIISAFRKANNGERPVLKAAYINGDVYTGDNNLVSLTKLKTKNELIGEVIGLLQSPAKRVIAALLNNAELKGGALVDSTPPAPADVIAAPVDAAPAAPVEEVPAAPVDAPPATPVDEAPAAPTEPAAPADPAAEN
jgi:large subunit ribosomal protein L10